MAESGQEGRDTDDLSEEASPYRAEEFRQKGQVSQSRELSGLVALLAAGMGTYALSAHMGVELGQYMVELFKVDSVAKLDLSDTHVLSNVFFKCLRVMAIMGLPVAVIGFIVGVLGSFVQVGAVFSSDPLTPDLTRIDPVQGFMKFFKLRQLLEGLRLLGKVVIIVWISYAMVKSRVFEAATYSGLEPHQIANLFGSVGIRIFMTLIAVLFVFAGLDFALQRWEFGKQLRMTKQEAKQEHKEHEGDPAIKARVRSIQREVARRRMMQAVKKADVIVTNPTHIAVALVYDKNQMAAPRVVAKGADFLAQKIKQIAAEAGVPMVENVPLARTLFKTVKVGQFIPKALYQAVAEVLAHVYRLKNRSF